MATADEIRAFAFQNYIKSARQQGESLISIRLGDICKEMGFARADKVADALIRRKFLEMYQLQLVSWEGPSRGKETVLTFRL